MLFYIYEKLIFLDNNDLGICDPKKTVTKKNDLGSDLI